LPSRTGQLIARSLPSLGDAFNLSAEMPLEQAGLLDEPPSDALTQRPPSEPTRDSRRRKKDALLSVYRSFTSESES